MLSFSVLPAIALFGGLFATSAVASPVSPSKCVTHSKGVLSTDVLENSTGQFNGEHKPFAFNSRGELSYYRTTQHPTIEAEFQTCTPNYAGNNNTGIAKVGRIYLPNTKKCLAVNNPSGSGPYHVTSEDCVSSSSGDMATAKSIPFNWISSRGYVSWVGSSNANGTRMQGGCPGGMWSYSADYSHVPQGNKAGEYRVNLACSRTAVVAQFWIS